MTAAVLPVADRNRRSATAPAPEPLWTEEDVATFLRVSERSVRRMRIPRVTLPGSTSRGIRRYDPEEVRAFVEGRKSARPAAARKAMRIV